MGAKPSTKIQTPPFKEQEWQYVPQEYSYPEYGIYRTMVNKSTGQKIDEYAMTWIDEESYEQYLRSVNFRYNHSYVVNTRYLVLKTEQQFCGQTYHGKVYIEHITHRLSQITDIPYPDNLYLLMEALQGYARIYKHSKYFQIEEGQICIDEEGNVKVWVNTDLSINYPNGDTESQDRHYGEEQMVDRLVYLVADNTDRQSQPEVSFMEYFEKRKGNRGKRFEEAKVMVLDYARTNDAIIPDKFEAIFNDKDQGEYTEPEEHFVASSSRRQEEPQFYSQHRPMMVVPPPAQPIPHPEPVYQRPLYGGPPIYQQQVYNSQPVFHIPHYQRIEYPAQQGHFIHNVQYQQPQSQPQQYIQFSIPRQEPQYFPQQNQPPQLQNQYYQSPAQPAQEKYQQVRNQPQSHSSPRDRARQSHNSHPNVIVQSKHQYQPSELQNSRRSNPHIQLSPQIEDESPVDIRITFNKTGQKENVVRGRKSAQMEVCIQPENSQYEASRSGQYRNSSIHEFSNNTVSETDDMVAKSLPIKAGYPSQNSQHLSSFGQNIYSHINQKQRENDIMAHQNTLGKDNYLIQSKKTNSHDKQIPKLDPSKTKYYFSLDNQELEIDPDIAADMAKYLR